MKTFGKAPAARLPGDAGLTRRRLLSGGAALLAGGLLPSRVSRAAGLPRRTEVAIVGAGMAGLAAAAALRERGFAVEVLEARDRIGGRAFTDRSLGLPYDAGAAWVHGADRSPLPPLLATLGFATRRDVAVPRLLLGRDPGDAARLFRELARLQERLAEAARGRGEGSMGEFLPPPEDALQHLARQLLGPLDLGGALDSVSLIDWWQRADRLPEDLVSEGLGSFVAAFGADQPVHLGRAVESIGWEPDSVELRLSGGAKLGAETVLVTVPTGVLAAGLESGEGLWFDPVLPPWKHWAIRGLPLGRIEKVALRLRPGLLTDWGYGENAWLLRQGEDGVTASLQLRPFGRDLAVVTLCGDEALRDAPGRIASALNHLAAVHPFSEDRDLRGVSASAWSDEAWSRGAYSYAQPGKASARLMLRKPLLGRVYFAGEACSRSWAGQLAGAFLTGEAAARQIGLRLLEPD